MSGFKSSGTRRSNQIRKTPGVCVWQRNYHDHVIRNESGLDRVREYIRNIPVHWEKDMGYPHNRKY
jgi:REP-associated tyrosine transposase